MFHEGISFFNKLHASPAAAESCELIQVEIDVYMPHGKYQTKPHSSPWFSGTCIVFTGHRNHFCYLYQQ